MTPRWRSVLAGLVIVPGIAFLMLATPFVILAAWIEGDE